MNQKHTYLFEMNRIAIPLILSTVTSVLMGIIDQAFVGHISLDAYAGVGLVCSCVNSLVGVLGAFSIVFNITGARLRGADDEKNLREAFTVWFLICAGVGISLFLLLNIFCVPILGAGFGLTGETLREAAGYLRIFSLSVPLNLLIFLYNGVFKVFRKTGHILGVTLLVNAVNILLDYMLIFGRWGAPRLGTSGAAIGTVSALGLNLLIYALIARRFIGFSRGRQGILVKIKEQLLFSLPFLGQEAMEDILFVVGLNMLIGRMGTLPLSAYNLLGQIISVVQMPMFGYGSAAASLSSEAWGREDPEGIRKIQRDAYLLLTGWFLFLFVLIMANARPIITLISDDPSLLALASACLPAALLIQAPNYGITVEKARLQATGHSGRTLAVTFAVNLAALLIIWLTARQLSILYTILGVSYLVTWAVLHFCIKK